MRPSRLGAALLTTVAIWTACSGRAYTATFDTDLGAKPQVQLPEGDPPEELVVQDVVEGDGEEVGRDSRLTAHYVGVSWSRSEQFESTWESDAPFTFTLDRVIEGWAEGLPGMRAGGRRALVIPPDLAYGDDTLVFVIDLLRVE